MTMMTTEMTMIMMVIMLVILIFTITMRNLLKIDHRNEFIDLSDNPVPMSKTLPMGLIVTLTTIAFEH